MAAGEIRAGDQLPLTIVDKEPATTGVAVLVFGLLAVAIPAFLKFPLLSGAKSQGAASPLASDLFLSILAAIGIGLVLYGIHRLWRRSDFAVDHAEVRCRIRTLRGAALWHESRQRYLGVLQKTELRRRGRNRLPNVFYWVVLKHDQDPSRDVPLYRSLDGGSHRAETERLANLLGTPALVERADGGYDTRAASDLDKSIADLAAEGRIEIPEAPTTNLDTARVRSVSHPDGYGFEQNFRGVSRFIGGGWLAAGLGLLFWYYVVGLGDLAGDTRLTGDTRLMALAGGLFSLAGLALLVVGQLAVYSLTVDLRRVRTELRLGAMGLRMRQLHGPEIEEVNLVPRTVLVVVGDHSSLGFGFGLKADALEHIHAAILATLARGPTRASAAPPSVLSPQRRRLRDFAIASLGAGRTPAQVAEKIASMGAPADDVAVSLRAIADDPASPHATAMRALIGPGAPATRIGVPPQRCVAATPAGLGAAPRFSRSIASFLGLAISLGSAGYIAAKMFAPEWFRKAPDPAHLARAAAAKQHADAQGRYIDEHFAAFSIKPAIGTQHVYVGGRGIRAEAHGSALRIVVDEIRLHKRPDRDHTAYKSLGIGVYGSQVSGTTASNAVWNREVRGTLDSATPVATLRGQVFTVPNMAAACAMFCRARLLLSVQVSPNSGYSENTPFASIALSATQSIAAPAPGAPSKYWDSFYDRAVAARAAGRHVEALRLFDETLSFIGANLGTDHPAAARTLVTQASLYKKLARNDPYIRSMERAWKVLDPIPDAEVKKKLGDIRFHIDKELVARQLGDYFWDRRIYDQAYLWYRRAHDAAPDLQTSDDNRNQRLASSAAGILATACVLKKTGEAERAMAELRKRIQNVSPSMQKRLQYWITTSEPMLRAGGC